MVAAMRFVPSRARCLAPAAALALVLAGAGCAAAPPRTAAASAPVIHQRAFVRADPQRGAWVAELLVEGDDASLRYLRLDGCGEANAEDAGAALARKAAETVRGGAPLEQALPDAAKADWRGALELGGGYRVEAVRIDDRYGPARVVRLAGPRGTTAELDRAPEEARVTLAPVGTGQVAIRLEGPGLLRDVRVADLAAARARMQVALGEEALAAGRIADALGHARQAQGLAPYPPPWSCHAEAGAAAWLQARALQARGAAADEVVEALGRAVSVDPSRYRMWARTADELAPLREDPRFRALVEPQPLPGSTAAP